MQMLPEAEAKRKVCPFTLGAPVPKIEGAGVFPTGYQHMPTNCMGAQCMAWTWDIPQSTGCGFCARLVKP